MKTITECIKLVLETEDKKPPSKTKKILKNAVHFGIPIGVIGGSAYVAGKGIKSLINQATQQN